MAAGAQAREQAVAAAWLRYRVQAPLDVTVLRSGIPDTLPGRSVNLGEGGVAAVLAGELLPGEAVGVEIRLPQAADPLRTRALVRHQDKLRSGLEFVGLSAEQQAAIRDLGGRSESGTGTGSAREDSDRSGERFRARGIGAGAQPPAAQASRDGAGYSCWSRRRSC